MREFSNLGVRDILFRNTGAIENFNSMLIKYAPKRKTFDNVYFIGRMLWQQCTTTCMHFGLLQQQQMEETVIGENIIKALRNSMLSQ